MKAKRMLLFSLVITICAHVFADESDPQAIFEKVTAKYKSMQTYQSEGRIVCNMDIDGRKTDTETSFTIKLKKPNLYLITWTQKNMPMPGIDQRGAVWSAGRQPYLYMGIMNAYFKEANDDVAIASATGISGGAAYTIPSLFLSLFKDQPPAFSRLIEPKLEKIEKVGDEECYVISASSTTSKKETFWISRERYLIIKYSRSLELPKGGTLTPEITDQQLEKVINVTEPNASEERKGVLKKLLKMGIEDMKTVKPKGTSTEFHVKITSPKLAKKDFEFRLPNRATLRESMF